METKEMLETIETELKSKFEELANRVDEKGSVEDIAKATAAVEEMKESMKKLTLKASLTNGNTETKSEGDKRITDWLLEGKATDGRVELKTVYLGDNSNAGYLVRPQLESTISTFAQEASVFASQVETVVISSDRMERVKNDSTGGSTFWGTELDAGTVETNLTLSKQIIPANDLYSLAYISRNMKADGPQVEAMIMEQVAYGFANSRNAAFFTGDGVGKPKGFLNDATIETAAAGSTTGLTVDGLIKFVGKLKPVYHPGAAFIMNQATLYDFLFVLEDAQERKYLLPDMRANVPFTFMGYPIIVDPNMPDLAENATPIAFGNWRQGYTIIERSGMAVQVDPYTQSPLIKYEFHSRVGGDVKVTEALKLLKIEA